MNRAEARVGQCNRLAGADGHPRGHPKGAEELQIANAARTVDTIEDVKWHNVIDGKRREGREGGGQPQLSAKINFVRGPGGKRPNNAPCPPGQ